jgi:hypothetical protein
MIGRKTKMRKTKEVPCTLTWHDGNEIPNPSTGSFLILNTSRNIAEAEFKDGVWIQYRWNATYKYKDIIAWCRFSDIKTPEGE